MFRHDSDIFVDRKFWKIRNEFQLPILGFDVNHGVLRFWIGLGKVLGIIGRIG